MTLHVNLKVMIYDHDFYGLHAINSYLAWDRRTRVVALAQSAKEMFDWLERRAEAEWPDTVIVDTEDIQTPEDLKTLIHRIHQRIKDAKVVILEHLPRADFALAALEGGAVGYLLRNDVGLQIASTIAWLQNVDFAVSSGVEKTIKAKADKRLTTALVLPQQRPYPELTDRIRQAIQLCVVEGMSADLAADEMGVSPHTIRSYIKEGYRIMEASDHNEYPAEMSAQERAFMRFTALDDSTTHQFLAPDESAPTED
ncbi:MAG: response regulator transcription factor [Chloroflexi bacterium]|nr:response regulator transcription factor [Chloroflexota bacterium]